MSRLYTVHLTIEATDGTEARMMAERIAAGRSDAFSVTPAASPGADLVALLRRMEWTASPASSETDPELFCPACDATCDALDRHDWTFGGECPHCGSGGDEDQNPALAYGPEGSCPRRHADSCPLAAAIR